MPPGPRYDTNVRGLWADVTNEFGWVTTAPSSLCPRGGPSTGPYVGVISGDRVYFYESRDCFAWFPSIPLTMFVPFARPNAPPLARIATTFYNNGSLYVLGTM